MAYPVGKYDTKEKLQTALEEKFPFLIEKKFKISVFTNGNWGANIETNYFRVTDLRSGCGCLVFSGYTMCDDKMVEVVKYVFQLYYNTSAYSNGTFITSLGNGYSLQVGKFLKDIGFKEIAYYPNHRHNDVKNTQKLYILTLDETSKIEKPKVEPIKKELVKKVIKEKL
jgi:hypothetical protein